MPRPLLHRPLICVLAFLITVGLSGCGGAQVRYASHVKRGKEFLAAGNLDKAGVEFRNAVQIQPKNAEALQLSGSVAEQRADIRQAAGLYQAAIEANPAYEPARASFGRLLVLGNVPKRALEVVAPGLAAHPDNVDLLAVRAAARHRLKDETAARADAERAVQLSPTNSNALAILAALCVEAKEVPRAISAVSAAVSQVPASAELRELLVNLYLMTGEKQQAEDQMRRIIELRPRDLSVRAQLAAHYVRDHKIDTAQSILEESVRAFATQQEQSKTNKAKLLFVDFLAAQRSRGQAEQVLRKYIAQEPDNYDLRFGLGSLLQGAGAVPEAIAVYQEVIARDHEGPKGLIARDRIASLEVGRGNYDNARKLIAEVLRNNARDDDALILRATLELRSHDPVGAIGDLRAVLRNQPSSMPLQRTLARAYMDKGDTALAEETLRSAMQSAPNDAGPRTDLAQVLGQTGRASDAIALLEQGVAKAPDSLPLREALTRVHIAQGNWPAARQAADDLKAHRPESPIGFYLAGLVARQENRLADSQKDLERALALRPTAFDVLSDLVRVELARGTPDAAITSVRGALEHNPENAVAVNLLGELYLQRKDLNQALENFNRASTLNPRLWQPHRNRALIKLQQRDPQGAIAEYEQAVQLAPGEAQPLLEVASLYETQGRSDEAIAHYESLYKSNPKMQQVAANNLAMLLVTYKSDRASLDRARDLTSSFTSSENGSLLDTTGWVRFKRGEYQDALPVLERALAKAPDSKVIRFHLAMAELQLGMRDRARSNLESALAGAANFSGSEEARTALAGLKSRSG